LEKDDKYLVSPEFVFAPLPPVMLGWLRPCLKPHVIINKFSKCAILELSNLVIVEKHQKLFLLRRFFALQLYNFIDGELERNFAS